MKNDDEIMAAEEFFGEIEEKKPSRACRPCGRKSGKSLFSEIKVKMVMRIYGVSRAKALKIVADRDGEHKAVESANDSSNTNDGDGFMTAEEFFGA